MFFSHANNSSCNSLSNRSTSTQATQYLSTFHRKHKNRFHILSKIEACLSNLTVWVSQIQKIDVCHKMLHNLSTPIYYFHKSIYLLPPPINSQRSKLLTSDSTKRFSRQHETTVIPPCLLRFARLHQTNCQQILPYFSPVGFATSFWKIFSMSSSVFLSKPHQDHHLLLQQNVACGFFKMVSTSE